MGEVRSVGRVLGIRPEQQNLEAINQSMRQVFADARKQRRTLDAEKAAKEAQKQAEQSKTQLKKNEIDVSFALGSF